MKSYETSTATLRAILSHPSLQRDKIDETMDAMASAQADAKEVDLAIRVGADMAQEEAGIDDADLEDELNALVKEAEEDKTRKEEEKAKLLTAESLLAPTRAPASEAEPVERIRVLEHS